MKSCQECLWYLYVFVIKINKGGELILSLGNVLTCDVA